MRELTKYLSLWLSLAKNSLRRQVEYKVNFVGRGFVELSWIFTQILFFSSLYLWVGEIAGWSEGEMWLFVSTMVLVDGLMMCLFFENQQAFTQLMRLGLFDYYLLYPASTRFLAGLRFVNVVSIINIIAGIAMATYTFVAFDLSLPPHRFVAWIFYMLVGTFLVGTLSLSVAAIAFWTTQSANLTWFFFEVYRMGMRPETFYGQFLQRFLRYYFPAALFMSVPAQIALGKLSGPFWYAFPIVVALIASIFMKLLWRRGIARYEGALS
jgi:ABC-2 type transport system permease protein